LWHNKWKTGLNQNIFLQCTIRQRLRLVVFSDTFNNIFSYIVGEGKEYYPIHYPYTHSSVLFNYLPPLSMIILDVMHVKVKTLKSQNHMVYIQHHWLLRCFPRKNVVSDSITKTAEDQANTDMTWNDIISTFDIILFFLSSILLFIVTLTILLMLSMGHR
jgi:hypothetical protein